MPTEIQDSGPPLPKEDDPSDGSTERGKRHFFSSKIFLYLGVGAGLLILAILLLFVWRSYRLSVWIHEDSANLSPYPNVLVEEGAAVASLEAPRLDRVLIEYNTRDRLVRHLSRSDYRYDIFGNTSWVKLYLTTYKPGDPRSVTRLKLLNRLEKTEEGWQVERVQELAIP